jgi:hypothetical protein
MNVNDFGNPASEVGTSRRTRMISEGARPQTDVTPQAGTVFI